MPVLQTFLLATDANLTTEFVGLYQLLHYTDLSDNPQDFVLYFGSLTADRQAGTATNYGVDNIELNVTDRLSEWKAATVYAVGQIIQPVGGNGYKYECTIGGTSHATTQPTWPVPPGNGYGSTVVDNTVTWELSAPRHALTEIKLALTALGLDTAVGGAALPLGNTVDSLVANKKEIHIRVTNAVQIVSNNTGQPEIGLAFNSVVETRKTV